jgi:hypothetical protein
LAASAISPRGFGLSQTGFERSDELPSLFAHIEHRA